MISLALVVMLLAGCSFPGTVRPTVKIGLVAPFEGRFRYVGYDVIYAVRLALREANAAGGVGGYSVELVAYDDGADSAMAIQQARKLAVDPEVVAAIGHFRDSTTAAALGTYAEAGVPLVAPAVLAPLPAGDEAGGVRSYHVAPGVDSVAGALAQRVERLGYDRVAFVAAGAPWGVALQRDAQRYGLRLSPVVSPQDADWLGLVMDAGVEAVICDADPVAAGETIAALREAGWEGAFLGGPELAAPDFVAVAGQGASGALFVTPSPFPADVPGGSDFVAAYRAVSNGVSPGPLAPLTYEATWVLLEALQRDIAARRVPTREGIAAALPSTSRKGVLGLIAFDADRSWSDAPLYAYRIGAEGVPAPINGYSATRR